MILNWSAGSSPAAPRRAPTPWPPKSAVVDTTDFLLRNTGVNAHDLFVDGGLLVT
jgi:hypothetical protein